MSRYQISVLASVRTYCLPADSSTVSRTRCSKRGVAAAVREITTHASSRQPVSVLLLRDVLTLPRLMHLLRSTLCIDSPVLPLYDAVLRESLSATPNVELDDIRWSQDSLPMDLKFAVLFGSHLLPIWLQLQALQPSRLASYTSSPP